VKVKIATEPFNGWLLREVLGYISDFFGIIQNISGIHLLGMQEKHVGNEQAIGTKG